MYRLSSSSPGPRGCTVDACSQPPGPSSVLPDPPSHRRLDRAVNSGTDSYPVVSTWRPASSSFNHLPPDWMWLKPPMIGQLFAVCWAVYYQTEVFLGRAGTSLLMCSLMLCVFFSHGLILFLALFPHWGESW